MTAILALMAASLLLGATGLGIFLWSLRSGQYDDLQGAATRILHDDPGCFGTRSWRRRCCSGYASCGRRGRPG